jgi:16S rRNA G966 N2-methylase RsmD
MLDVLKKLEIQWKARNFIVRGVVSRIRYSPLSLCNWVVDRLCDHYVDRKFGIASSERRSLADLAIELPDCVHYQPTSYSDFSKLLATVGIRSNQDVFLDFGAGMGRVVCLAATYPFRSVIGVELSASLCLIAKRNIDNVRSKLRCQEIKIVNANAVDYAVPDEVSMIFFFNPFRGSVMEKVLANIVASLRAKPRRVLILFYGDSATVSANVKLMHAQHINSITNVMLPTGAVGAVFDVKPEDLYR